MAKYHVVDGHKKFKGRLYAPGDEIECSKEIAQALRLKPVAVQSTVEDRDDKTEPDPTEGETKPKGKK